MLALTAKAAPPPLPVTPGGIGATLQRPEQLQETPTAPEISQPRKNPEAASEQGPKIVVQQFKFSGNTVFGDDVLQPLVAGYLNKPISLGQLYEAADSVAEFYAGKGYTLANVAVPAQTVSGGTVTLEVIEGRVGRIGFEGNHRYHDGTLGAFVTHTRGGEIYRSPPLEDDLQTLNALPGLEARAVLKPGSDYGTSDITIKTQEHLLDGNLVVDNYGRRDTGELRTSGSLTVNNPIGIGDQLEVLGTHSGTNQLNYGYVDYSIPLDHCGLRFDANYGYAFFQLNVPAGGGGGVSKLDGKNVNAEANLQQTWWRTAADTFTTSAGFLHTNANATIGGVVSTVDTNVNLLNLMFNYAHIWTNAAATQIAASIHTNFDGSGPGPGGTPGDLKREVFRGEINVQHLQPLAARLQLLAQLDGEYSPDALADTEKLSIGGPTSVRGFQPSEARGDRGYFAQLSLRRPFPAGPVTVLPRVFGDAGRVISVNPAGFGNTGLSLASAGVGADVLYRKVSLKVDWSYPFDDKPESDGRSGGRVYAALAAGF